VVGLPVITTHAFMVETLDVRGEKPQRPAPRVKPAEELSLIRDSARKRGKA